MKKVSILLLILSLNWVISCKNGSNQQLSENKSDSTTIGINSNTKLEVIYFHATHRCVTCNAVEKHTKAVLNERFDKELKNGIIIFRSINIDESENLEITEKFQISFSTLLLINHQNGKEEVTDFTETAFQNAKNDSKKYADLFEKEIQKLLINP